MVDKDPAAVHGGTFGVLGGVYVGATNLKTPEINDNLIALGYDSLGLMAKEPTKWATDPSLTDWEEHDGRIVRKFTSKVDTSLSFVVMQKSLALLRMRHGRNNVTKVGDNFKILGGEHPNESWKVVYDFNHGPNYRRLVTFYNVMVTNGVSHELDNENPDNTVIEGFAFANAAGKTFEDILPDLDSDDLGSVGGSGSVITPSLNRVTETVQEKA